MNLLNKDSVLWKQSVQFISSSGVFRHFRPEPRWSISATGKERQQVSTAVLLRQLLLHVCKAGNIPYLDRRFFQQNRQTATNYLSIKKLSPVGICFIRI
jgi:hypothetical protein